MGEEPAVMTLEAQSLLGCYCLVNACERMLHLLRWLHIRSAGERSCSERADYGAPVDY
jgi:hypothetical protein